MLGVQKEPRTIQRCVLLTLLIKKGRELLCIKYNGILTTNRHSHKRQTNKHKQTDTNTKYRCKDIIQREHKHSKRKLE